MEEGAGQSDVMGERLGQATGKAGNVFYPQALKSAQFQSKDTTLPESALWNHKRIKVCRFKPLHF